MFVNTKTTIVLQLGSILNSVMDVTFQIHKIIFINQPSLQSKMPDILVVKILILPLVSTFDHVHLKLYHIRYQFYHVRRASTHFDPQSRLMKADQQKSDDTDLSMEPCDGS